MKIERYQRGMGDAWNGFVARSKNGTFLFDRGYMDYHADRFEDHSLVVRDGSGGIVALLPANRSGARLASHAGLTYGGFVVDERMGAAAMLEVFDALRRYLGGEAIEALAYKTVPSIYHAYPAEEDRYALFRAGATLYRRDVLAVLCPGHRPAYQERRVRMMKRAAKAQVAVESGSRFAHFWPILEANLQRVHGTRPVHSLAEIEMLAARFPDNIRLHLAVEGGEPIAGVVIYDTKRVAHVQYIASSERAREVGALDRLFAALIEEVYAGHAWFDFGISNEDDGRVLNVGLVEQKEGFGARAMAHDFYEVRPA